MAQLKYHLCHSSLSSETFDSDRHAVVRKWIQVEMGSKMLR